MSFFRSQFLQSAHATLYSATGDTDPSVLSAPVTPISLTRQTQLTNRTELSFLVMGTIEQPSWVETRSYQQQAIRRWLDAEAQGILHMATGTGKTVTSLLAATRLAETAGDRLLLVIAVPYQHLVDQWAADVRDFGVQPVLAYQSRSQWQPRLERELLEFNRGVRDVVVVVTTHKTLASAPTQRTLGRVTDQRALLIADEVHHVGAPYLQQGLSAVFQFRLGLSATPQRWYDEEGTRTLTEYFGDVVYTYDLKQAIENGSLCEYYYIPHIVEFDDEEMDEYMRLTAKIGRLVAKSGEDGLGSGLEENPALQRALFKRARLIGTASAKLDVLVDLFSRESTPHHSLVYCSDGSTGVGPDAGKRHVDAVTTRLRRECDLRVNRFTARESQAEREGLLGAFESGEIEVLTAIRCLDEGVDVPATRTAYLLASTSNPRQYVQRRGRILRTHRNKKFAVIHDFVTVPDTSRHPELLSKSEYSAERTLIRKELERVSTFTAAARNHPDAEVDGVPTTDGSLQSLRRRYDLLSS